MQPVWASISNAFGRKPPFYISMGLFFVGSILFATAQNMGTIIAGRVLQGLGGGGIDVLVQVILADMTTLEERSKYLGLMAIPSAVGNIMGPTVGAPSPRMPPRGGSDGSISRGSELGHLWLSSSSNFGLSGNIRCMGFRHKSLYMMFSSVIDLRKVV